MRLTRLLLLPALALSLGACQSSGTNWSGIAAGVGSVLNTESLARFTQVAQAAARVACAMEPTAASIAALVDTSGASLTAFKAAQIACAALTQQPSAAFMSDAPKGSKVRVQGEAVVDGKVVVIEGRPKAATKADEAQAKMSPSVTAEK